MPGSEDQWSNSKRHFCCKVHKVGCDFHSGALASSMCFELELGQNLRCRGKITSFKGDFAPESWAASIVTPTTPTGRLPGPASRSASAVTIMASAARPSLRPSLLAYSTLKPRRWPVSGMSRPPWLPRLPSLAAAPASGPHGAGRPLRLLPGRGRAVERGAARLPTAALWRPGAAPTGRRQATTALRAARGAQRSAGGAARRRTWAVRRWP